ncbi:MAG: protein-glutamate methylesterase/protein-glutamine glutaminase [Bacillota bacterium]
MSKIRVLVVDDSAFMRKVISDIINADEELELVGTARNGQDALDKIPILQPDVITLDVEMPQMNGLEALQKIMQIRPTPVVMLSSLTQLGADITIKSLAYGAIDFVQKPGGAISLNINDAAKEIIQKIKMAKRANLKQDTFVVKEKIEQSGVAISPPNSTKWSDTSLDFPLVVIGTSTGGPKALHNVIENLPENLNAAILIVQHMPPGFTKSLAQRLNSLTQLIVKEGENGEKLQSGYIYVAPGNYQMEVQLNDFGELVLCLHQGPLVTGHRPSVDALFKSVANTQFKKVVAVIMTGMGYDGRAGIKELKGIGAYTIAEAEETCVVFGMPKAAIEAGAINRIVPLQDIAKEIVKGVNFINI